MAARKREGTAASDVTRHKRVAECGGNGGSGGEIAGETPRRPCPSVCGFRKRESPESASLAKWNELSGNIHIPSISLGHAREFSMRRNCSGPHAPLYFISWNSPRFRIGAKAIRMIGNMQAIECLPESAKFEPELTRSVTMRQSLRRTISFRIQGFARLRNGKRNFSSMALKDAFRLPTCLLPDAREGPAPRLSRIGKAATVVA